MRPPWWAESSIPWLESILKERPKARIFEYGSGESSAWLANRCLYFLAVEHDPEWLSRSLGKSLPRACIFLRPLDHTYETAIWGEEGNSFDLVIVDGRRRVECVRQCRQFVKRGGYLVLDDSQRKDRYKEALQLLLGWNPKTFFDQGEERTTTVFTRPRLGRLPVDESLPPFFIPVRDRLTTLDKLMGWLESHGMSRRRVWLVDNGTTFGPTIEFLKGISLNVIRPETNLGARGLFKLGGVIEKIAGRDKPFFISDPDILPAESCQSDLLQHLVRSLARYQEFVKVGLSLRIDDIPDSYPLKKQVQSWEKRFWVTEANRHFYRAEIATTFCLVRSLNHCDANGYGKGAQGRTKAPNIGIHESWYFGPEHMPEDEAYYLKHVPLRRPGSVAPGSTWVPGSKYGFGWTGSP